MIPTIVKNAIIGDGRIIRQVNGAAFYFMSADKDYADFKARLFNDEFREVAVRYLERQSGYKKGSIIHEYRTSQVENSSLSIDWEKDLINQILPSLSEYDLFLWYLDDGSWHKKRNTMHLYSNMLSKEQTELLADRIELLYGIRPTIRIDRKKDGREFYYLYYPRRLVNIVHPIYKRLIIESELPSMMYKVGGDEYVDKKAAA